MIRILKGQGERLEYLSSDEKTRELWKARESHYMRANIAKKLWK